MPVFPFKEFIKPAKEETGLIYCDMDGVLVDFDGGVKKILPELFESVHPYNYNIDSSGWTKINAVHNWWYNLEPTKDCRMLWQYINGPKTFILSAVPHNGDANPDEVRKEKLMWCRRYLGIGPNNIIITKREAKKLYAKTNGIPNILIDDTQMNIDEWVRSGGKGILHKSAKDTISKLKSMGY